MPRRANTTLVRLRGSFPVRLCCRLHMGRPDESMVGEEHLGGIKRGCGAIALPYQRQDATVRRHDLREAHACGSCSSNVVINTRAPDTLDSLTDHLQVLLSPHRNLCL